MPQLLTPRHPLRRLNLQHYLWTQMFGYLLHPMVDTSSDTLKVADIGTGTG